MDIRHPLKDLDLQMLEWASNSDLNILVLLTKADKLNANPRRAIVQQVRKATMVFGDNVKVEAFSSLKGIGVPEVTRILSDWYQPEIDPDAIADEAE
jgi:GTP-binding protein